MAEHKVRFREGRPDEEIWTWLSSKSFSWSPGGASPASFVVEGRDVFPMFGDSLRDSAQKVMESEEAEAEKQRG